MLRRGQIPLQLINLVRRQARFIGTNIIDSPHPPCPVPELSLVQSFFKAASVWPHQTAVECGVSGRKLTYDQLRNRIRRFGSSLKRMGFKPGESIAIVLPNVPEFPVALYGAAGIGMSVVLVNPTYTTGEMIRQLEFTAASVIVGEVRMVDTFRHIARKCPSIRQMISVGGSSEGFVSFNETLNDTGNLFDENIHLDIFEEIFVLPSSSGTTGLPKSVMLTHANVAVNIHQVLVPGTCNLLRATGDFQDIFICLLPFTHIYGLVVQMLSAFELGAKIVVLPKFQLPTYLQAIEKAKPTVLHLVPPLISLLSQIPTLNPEAFDRLRVIFSGAAPLGPTVAFNFLQRLNKPDILFQEGYGLTECSPGTHMSPLANSKIGSIGSPLSRTRAKIVDLVTGDALGSNQRGELCVQGPQVMKGYFKNAEATRDVVDSSGWLHTGDIAFYDEDGHFFIVDRLKDLIKVKAHQVSPSELEDLIRQHPAVVDVGVIGVPDEYAGELPRAFVIKKPGSTMTEAELKHFVDPKVAGHKRLKGGVEFVDSLPLSSTGKILRRELRASYLRN